MPDPRPMPEICPFLAAARDPDSVLAYASADNLCHKLGDPVDVTTDYQTDYCLRARHWFCPVYTGAVKRPPIPIRAEGSLAPNKLVSAPPDSGAIPLRQLIITLPAPAQAIPPPQPVKKRRWGRIAQVIAAALFILVVGRIVYLAQNRPRPVIIITTTETNTPATPPTETLIPTPTTLPSETATTRPTLTATLTETPSATFTPSPTSTPAPTFTPSLTVTASLTPTLKPCQAPADWVKYTVAAGETYFKIASRYGLTVEALQKINCLSDPARLLSGQTLFVPPVTPTPASATPAPSATPTTAPPASTPP